MSDFAQLLAAIQSVADDQDTLAKSLAAGGENLGDGNPEDEEEAAAAAAAAAAAEAEAAAAAAGTPGENAPEGTALTKSLTVDGEQVDLVDADQLFKSLSDLETRLTEHEGMLTKSLSPVLDVIKNQNALIKSLGERLDVLAGQGRGRKTVLTISERPAPGQQPLTKSEPVQLSAQDLLTKSLQAQREGKITGADVARVEVALQSGLSAPADVLARI